MHGVAASQPLLAWRAVDISRSPPPASTDGALVGNCGLWWSDAGLPRPLCGPAVQAGLAELTVACLAEPAPGARPMPFPPVAALLAAMMVGGWHHY